MAHSREEEDEENYNFKSRNYDENNTYNVSNRNRVPVGTARVVVIEKSETGFGFNVRGQVNEGGQLRSINGELYAPMQHVSAVLRNGSADRAGVIKGDRIMEVNGVNVEGATHKQVVDLIRSGSDRLILTVISVPQRVSSDSVEGSEASSCASLLDFSEKRSLPISIPDSQTIHADAHKFTIFNIHIAGRHLCSRRYSEFYRLNQVLKREFLDFNFPKFPAKKFFQLSEQQLDSRRRGLEFYLEKVCATVVIAESDFIREFLSPSNLACGAQNKVEMKVLLPDQSCITLHIHRLSLAIEVYQALVEKLSWSQEVASYFFLHEIEENNFERRLNDNEKPHSLYVENYSSSTLSCITLNRCVFSAEKERETLFKDETALKFLFYLAQLQVQRGQLTASSEQAAKLRSLKEEHKEEQFVRMCQKLPGYGSSFFPYCQCEARKEGGVVLSVGVRGLVLHACSPEALLDGQKIEFNWSEVVSMEADLSTFTFDCRKANRKQRTVRLFSKYGSQMLEASNLMKTTSPSSSATSATSAASNASPSSPSS